MVRTRSPIDRHSGGIDRGCVDKVFRRVSEVMLTEHAAGGAGSRRIALGECEDSIIVPVDNVEIAE